MSTQSHPKISVIISTYNAEAWLEKVLWSYQAQSFKDFEVIIADDGSQQPTFDLVTSMKEKVDFPITQVWHKDRGFQKTIILNQAILKCKSDYIVMTDGDCIARKDFLQTHYNHSEKGYFLSGGYFKLPLSISQLISKEDLLHQRCFDINWLKSNGLQNSFKNNKITAKGFKQKFLNRYTPTKATWNGHNASGWKADILAVNGFDERMQYGGEDRELGERLFNYGIKAKQIRYSAICLHLDHQRGYVKPEMIEKNKKIRAEVKEKQLTWTAFGIQKS